MFDARAGAGGLPGTARIAATSLGLTWALASCTAGTPNSVQDHAERPRLVYFYRGDSESAGRMAPIIDRLETDFVASMSVVRVDVEADSDGMGDYLDPDAPRPMPAFGDVLTDDEIHAVIEYFKSLWSAENRAYQLNETVNPPGGGPVR